MNLVGEGGAGGSAAPLRRCAILPSICLGRTVSLKAPCNPLSLSDVHQNWRRGETREGATLKETTMHTGKGNNKGPTRERRGPAAPKTQTSNPTARRCNTRAQWRGITTLPGSAQLSLSTQQWGECASLLHVKTWLGDGLSLCGKPWIPGSVPRRLKFPEPERASPRGCCPWSTLTLVVLGGCSRVGIGGYKPCNFVTSSVVTVR